MTRMKDVGVRYAMAGKLFGSTALAQGAALVATVVAATSAGPTDFAIYAGIRAATAAVSSVNALATETRLPVVSDDDSRALIRAATTTVVTTSALTVLVGAVASLEGATWASIALLLGPSFLAVSALNVVTSAVVRASRPHLLARNRVLSGFSNAALIIGLIFTSLPGYLVLTGAFVVSTLLGVLVMLHGLPGWLSQARPAHRGDWRIVRREVGWQPLNNLAANLGTALPALLLPAFGATALAGAWALLSRIMNAVVNVVYSTAAPLYTAEFARLVRDGDSSERVHLHRRWLGRLSLLVIPSVVGIIVGVLWVVPLLGEQWNGVSTVLVPACLSFAVLILWLPMSQTLVLVGRTTLELVWTLGNLAVSAATLALIPVLGGEQALTVWAVAQALSLMVHVAMQRRAVREPLPGVAVRGPATSRT
ncbi:lipopolysaccharide biosynthesis protein [Phycicoccus sp. Root563]|uniref:lipopolysaccharide biosynthesis protein n=1 Tax=Phycicoccus sp. Root563 TaxID=1736562 RepID=UPI0007035C09|nr:hypothetical protein [Phycicoccus sp. Root563]